MIGYISLGMLGLLLIGSLFFSMPGRWCAAQFEIAATVDGQPVNVKRLQLQVGLVLKKTPAEGLKLKIIQAQVLEENIKQRLVFIYLQGSQHKASQAEIDAQSSNLETELIEQKSNLKQYLPHSCNVVFLSILPLAQFIYSISSRYYYSLLLFFFKKIVFISCSL